MPGNVTVDEETPTSISISWTAASGSFDYYEVAYAEAGGPTLIAGNLQPDSSMLEFTLEDLDPETEYMFTVLTVVGEGDMQERSEPSTVTANTEALNPLQVIVIDYDTDSITILWGETTQTGAAAYLIDLTPSDGSAYPSAVTIDDENRYDFTGLIAGREYTIEITVSGFNEKTMIVQRTVPHPPRNLRSISETETTVTIAWNAPINGFVDTYILTYEPADGKTASPITVEQDTLQLVIEGLTPSSQYDITLIGVAGTGSDKTESAKIMASVNTSAASPAQVIIKTVTTTKY
uniref:Fibronectin-like n=1 Tax=Saccoglossus kowalevskii TaxID=10224 RepID=A0ABM0M5F2_SACKO|nr:PREDICTED: fibronectin-like [Saccoglossus kowalevskii]